MAEDSDIQKLKTEIPRFNVPKTRIYKTVGFMHPFKNKEIVFKIKDMTQLRNNKGAKCEDASKPVIIDKITDIWKEEVCKGARIEKYGLAVILEISMRWKTEQNPEEMIMFLYPEQANLNDIVDM